MLQWEHSGLGAILRPTTHHHLCLAIFSPFVFALSGDIAPALQLKNAPLASWKILVGRRQSVVVALVSVIP